MSRGEAVLIGLFLFLAAAGTGVALTFPVPESRQFPIVWGIFTTVVILFYIGASTIPSWRRRFYLLITDALFRFPGQAEGTGEEEEREPRSAVEIRRQRLLVAQLVGYGIAAWLFGVLIASALYMLVMLRWFSGERWTTSVAVAGVTLLFIYVVFDLLLRIPLF